MGNVDAFLKQLQTFDKDNTPIACVDKVEKEYLSNPNFKPEYIRSKSGAAAGLCGWIVNICKYFRIYQVHLDLVFHAVMLFVIPTSSALAFHCHHYNSGVIQSKLPW